MLSWKMKWKHDWNKLTASKSLCLLFDIPSIKAKSVGKSPNNYSQKARGGDGNPTMRSNFRRSVLVVSPRRPRCAGVLRQQGGTGLCAPLPKLDVLALPLSAAPLSSDELFRIRLEIMNRVIMAPDLSP